MTVFNNKEPGWIEVTVKLSYEYTPRIHCEADFSDAECQRQYQFQCRENILQEYLQSKRNLMAGPAI
jgi:hypothetical protein